MDTTPRTILLVDDDPLVRGMLRDYLRRNGSVVVDVDNARAAVEILQRGSFDAVVSDIDMPGRSGLWLLRQVRTHWDDLPVILITGRPPTKPNDADAVLVKPYAGNDLYARIRALTAD